MSKVILPHKAVLALAALKAQSAIVKEGANTDDHYKALQGMAENEPWTSHIIRAARSGGAYVDFGKLDDEWLQHLAMSLPRSQLQEFQVYGLSWDRDDGSVDSAHR